jgi:hypothetical protein
VLVAALALTACSSPRPEPSPSPQPRVADACGPVASREVAGQRPDWIDASLTAFSNDEHACRALWLPSRSTETTVDRRSLRWFVPQGLAVRGDTAWVSGYDGSRNLGRRYCLLMKVSLKTGPHRRGHGAIRLPHRLSPCRRAGARRREPVAVTTQTPVADGSRHARDARHARARRPHLRVVRHRARRGDWTWVFQPTPARPVRLDLHRGTRHDRSVRGGRVGARTTADSGAWWGTIGQRTGLWLTTSVTRCGVLTGPGGVARAFVPGAEGIVGQGDRLWVVSETPSKSYQEAGGRPIVAALMAYDAGSLMARGHEVDCEP